MKTQKIEISSIVGAGSCVSAEDGQRVYEAIHGVIESGSMVQLSFVNVTRLTTAFLNTAVGQLYGEFSEEEIKRLMSVPLDYEPWQLQRLKLVTDRAKVYFSDREKFEAVNRRFVGEDE